MVCFSNVASEIFHRSRRPQASSLKLMLFLRACGVLYTLKDSWQLQCRAQPMRRSA